MRRILLLAPLLLFTAGCGLARSAESGATDVARDAAGKAAEQLDGRPPRTAEEVGWAASQIEGVEVMRVTGTSTHAGDGVDLVVRTSGSAYNRWVDLEEITVRRCFTVRVSTESRSREDPHAVDCPDGPALAFAPPPEPPRLPGEELRAALPRVPRDGRVDEAGVRRALAALDLDPGIRTEVKSDRGRVGVVLVVEAAEGDHVDPRDCLLARVVPGATEVWVPPRIQRMPGEGGCTVANALDPAPPAH
ncbi:translation initiation factor IF-2 [Streptomyces tendae]|uniref:Translation initiation factor IF-2 n=1 Tax=Streptomyces tendae TaxID=1932 RepID=A0ABW7S800_STRTE